MYLPQPAPYFRRSFTVTQKVLSAPLRISELNDLTTSQPTRAALYIAGVGLYELWLNGASATDTVINTVWTRFDKVVQYRLFDLIDTVMVRISFAVIFAL